MSEPTNWKQRYTQFFVVFIMCGVFLVMFQGLSGGFANFDANIPARASLITLFTRIRLKLGDRVFNQTLVGKDGWMEYTSSRNMDDFQNSMNLPAGYSNNIQKKLQALYDVLRKRNITLVVVVAPNKATIYPDKLPDEIKKVGEKSQLDLLVTTMQQQGPSVLVDLRPALIQARQERQIYYKTDTHWNAFGAYVAYSEIMKKLAEAHPELAPRKINQFKIKENKPIVFGITRLIGATFIKEPLYSITPSSGKDNLKWVVYNSTDNYPMSISYSQEKNLPRGLIYIDSFGVPLVPLIAPHFSQATFIHRLSSSTDAISFKQIEVSKPDIVVLEIVERSLPGLDDWLNKFGLDSK